MGSPFLPLFQLCNFPPPAPFSKGEFGGRAIYVTWFVRMQGQKQAVVGLKGRRTAATGFVPRTKGPDPRRSA